MRNHRNILVAGVILAMSAVVGLAQSNYTGIPATRPGVAGVYTYQNGTTGVIAPNSTNTFWNYPTTNTVSTNVFQAPNGNSGLNGVTNLIQLDVSQFDYVGYSFGFTGTATSTNDFAVYSSTDGGLSFQVVPIWSVTGLAPGAAAWNTNGVIDCHGVTTLAVVAKNRGTTLATNALAALTLKANKVGAVIQNY